MFYVSFKGTLYALYTEIIPDEIIEQGINLQYLVKFGNSVTKNFFLSTYVYRGAVMSRHVFLCDSIDFVRVVMMSNTKNVLVVHAPQRQTITIQKPILYHVKRSTTVHANNDS